MARLKAVADIMEIGGGGEAYGGGNKVDVGTVSFVVLSDADRLFLKLDAIMGVSVGKLDGDGIGIFVITEDVEIFS
ncbi:hypothetical protein HDU76_010493 [Blyttiomyces sp. JEL0837]|nr:hypothetical protein HDU76_010493 [Blyttiomyces sp. JEL0837]